MVRLIRRMASFQNFSLSVIIWFVWGLGGISSIGGIAFLQGHTSKGLHVSTVGIGLFLIGLIFTLLALREIRRRIHNLEHLHEIVPELKDGRESLRPH